MNDASDLKNRGRNQSGPCVADPLAGGGAPGRRRRPAAGVSAAGDRRGRRRLICPERPAPPAGAALPGHRFRRPRPRTPTAVGRCWPASATRPRRSSTLSTGSGGCSSSTPRTSARPTSSSTRSRCVTASTCASEPGSWSTTLTPADLLLSKLQVINTNEKDFKDATARARRPRGHRGRQRDQHQPPERGPRSATGAGGDGDDGRREDPQVRAPSSASGPKGPGSRTCPSASGMCSPSSSGRRSRVAGRCGRESATGCAGTRTPKTSTTDDGGRNRWRPRVRPLERADRAGSAEHSRRGRDGDARGPAARPAGHRPRLGQPHGRHRRQRVRRLRARVRADAARPQPTRGDRGGHEAAHPRVHLRRPALARSRGRGAGGRRSAVRGAGLLLDHRQRGGACRAANRARGDRTPEDRSSSRATTTVGSIRWRLDAGLGPGRTTRFPSSRYRTSASCSCCRRHRPTNIRTWTRLRST